MLLIKEKLITEIERNFSYLFYYQKDVIKNTEDQRITYLNKEKALTINISDDYIKITLTKGQLKGIDNYPDEHSYCLSHLEKNGWTQYHVSHFYLTPTSSDIEIKQISEKCINHLLLNQLPY